MSLRGVEGQFLKGKFLPSELVEGVNKRDKHSMRLLLLTLLMSSFAWGKPTVLVSYFDPFGKAPANNSGTVAALILAKMKSTNLPFEIKLCEVETKFDVSFNQLKDCVNALPERPVLVISLGETGCEMKAELMGRNLDRTKGPDNSGVERRNTPIISGAPFAVGFNYPLPEMYCALSTDDRKELAISNNAGSFVCNNLSFQTTLLEDDLNFGFIHVPSHFCRDVKSKNDKIASNLLKMIGYGVEVSLSINARPRLPVTKAELEILRSENQNDECKKSFYKQARAWDEKTRWSIFKGN